MCFQDAYRCVAVLTGHVCWCEIQGGGVCGGQCVSFDLLNIVLLEKPRVHVRMSPFLREKTVGICLPAPPCGPARPIHNIIKVNTSANH